MNYTAVTQPRVASMMIKRGKWLEALRPVETMLKKGVDKTRNMEHPGTSRNMKKLKYIFFYEKKIN